MVLLDRGGDHAGDADAVTAHIGGNRLALFVEHGRRHRFRVLPPELKNVADLDTAQDLQGTVAIRARVAVDDVAQVDADRLGAIAAPVGVDVMAIVGVGAADEVRGLRSGMIDVGSQAEVYGPD